MKISKAMCLGLGLMTLVACGRKVESKFFVEGACADCAPLIEASLADLPAVKEAYWVLDNSTLVVSYDTTRISIDSLQAAVAERGFNTQFFPANETARAALPACCRTSITQKLKVPDAHP